MEPVDERENAQNDEDASPVSEAPSSTDDDDWMTDDLRAALERVREIRLWKNLHWRPGQ